MTKNEQQTFDFLRGWYRIRAGWCFSWADGVIFHAAQYVDDQKKEKAILDILSEMPESWQKVIRFLCFEALSIEETAVMMCRSRQHVINLRGLALRRFRELWKNHGDLSEI